LISKCLGTADGLKYYDLVEGKGPTAEKGSTVQVISPTCTQFPILSFLTEVKLMAIFSSQGPF
jgi:hypothetical protein